MLALRRFAFNRVDLAVGICVAVVGAYFLWGSIVSGNNSVAAALFSAWIAACIGGGVKITSTRRSLIILFASEIKAIQDGLTIMKMFEFWADLHKNPEKGTRGFADVPRQEDYFQIFHGVGNNIGNLHPDVVEGVVRFYTYLKMSRDAAVALRSWEEQTDLDMRKLDVTYVVDFLAHSMLWGFIALWAMGYEADTQDDVLRKSMKRAYDQIKETGAFEQLWRKHLRSKSLIGFFRKFPHPCGDEKCGASES